MHYYKLEVQGIVYLVDPSTAFAYTYDLTNPTRIGRILWADSLKSPTIELLSDWQTIMNQKINT
jgi:hypothetical protein